MKKLSFALAAVLVSGAAWIGLAEDGKTDKAPPPPEQKNVVRQDREADLLRAEMHRVMAELIEAQLADKPDAAKIDELMKRFI